MTRTAFKLIRLGALVAPAGYIAVQPWTMEGKVSRGLSWYTGFDISTGTFHFDRLMKGWGPYLGAMLTTYGIPKIAGILRKI